MKRLEITGDSAKSQRTEHIDIVAAEVADSECDFDRLMKIIERKIAARERESATSGSSAWLQPPN